MKTTFYSTIIALLLSANTWAITPPEILPSGQPGTDEVLGATSSEDDAAWTDWISVGSGIYVSYKVSHCYEGMLSGYSFYRTNNTNTGQRGSVYFEYRYSACSGETQTSNSFVDLAKTGVDESRGMWFMGYRMIDYVVSGSVKVQHY